jgi:hypothetical protein
MLPDSHPTPRAGGVVFVPQRDPVDAGKDLLATAGSMTQILAAIASVVALIATVSKK